MTNECPEDGLLISVEGVEQATNQKGKPEYHWDVTHYTPAPIKKICTESSMGFCTALAQIGKSVKDLKGKVLHVKWSHEQISGGRNMKVFQIKECSQDDLKGLF